MIFQIPWKISRPPTMIRRMNLPMSSTSILLAESIVKPPEGYRDMPSSISKSMLGIKYFHPISKSRKGRGEYLARQCPKSRVSGILDCT